MDVKDTTGAHMLLRERLQQVLQECGRRGGRIAPLVDHCAPLCIRGKAPRGRAGCQVLHCPIQHLERAGLHACMHVSPSRPDRLEQQAEAPCLVAGVRQASGSNYESTGQC